MGFTPWTDSYEGIYFEVKGRYPDQGEIDKTCWLHDLTGKDSYIFHGASFDGDGGLYCWGRSAVLGEWVSDARIQQCPLCGQITFGFKAKPGEKDELSISGHACLVECEIAKKYDVDAGFLDWQDLTQVKLQNPESSPMLALAYQAARSVRFEDQDHLREIAGIAASVRTLRDQQVWCHPDIIAGIVQIAIELRRNPDCPHYECGPYYVAHLEHLRSKSLGPCPCSSCCRAARRESAPI